MSITMDQLSLLATAMIKQAKNDLVSEDDYLTLRTAKYFFLEPVEKDNGDLTRFAGLCTATQINANAAAQAIFNELLPHQQKRIRNLLHNADYNFRPKESLTV